MIKFFSAIPVIFALLFIALLLFLGAGCSAKNPYVGPTIGTVGVTGSYSDKSGDTYGGGVQVGLDYPSPTPTPKPVLASK